MAQPVAVWDFTLPAGDRTSDEVIKVCKQLFKKWTVQKEQGDEGYLHFQGRGSLFKKRRLVELKKLLEDLNWRDCHVSPSSTNSTKGDALYSCKADTRVEGPWTNKDETEEVYIPRQYRNLVENLWPYQKKIWDSADVFDARTINLVYDPDGNNGKSTIAALMDLYKRGIDLPPINDAEKLIQSVADIFMATEIREPKAVFVDLPRAMDKRKLGGMYTAIEQIKKGKVYDVRYHYRQWWFDAPQIWVFTNTPPDLSMLSRDRWVCWTVKDRDLISLETSEFVSEQFDD